MINYFTINLNYIKRINALTNHDLKEVIDVSISTISLLMNGKADPNTDTLLKISDTFGYSIDDLLKVEIEKSNKFRPDYVNEDGATYDKVKNDSQFEDAKKIINDLKYQVQQKDLIISEIIKDKNVFRDQAEKYLQLLTQKK